MHRKAKPGKSRRASKLRAFFASSLGLCAGLGGCSSSQLASGDKLGDPLLGPAPPPNVQPSTPTQAGMAPIPQNADLNTNAALASQTPAGQGLAITGADSWARKVDGASPAAGKGPAASGAQPRVEAIPADTTSTTSPIQPSPPAIQPIQPTAWSAGSQSSPVPSPAASTPPSDDQLDKMFTARGVIAHNGTPVPGGIHLVVIVRIPPNPTATPPQEMQQTYEATAVDYPTAALAILRELDAQRPHP